MSLPHVLTYEVELELRVSDTKHITKTTTDCSIADDRKEAGEIFDISFEIKWTVKASLQNLSLP